MHQFHVDQVIGIRHDAFWARVHFDRDLNRSFYLDELGYEAFDVLEFDEDDVKVTQVARVVPRMAVPAIIRKHWGDLSYIEKQELQRSSGVAAFEIRPRLGGIVTTGTTRIEPLSEGSCRRRVDVRVETTAPVIGKVVERFAESAARRAYEKQANFVNRWLEKRRDIGQS